MDAIIASPKCMYMNIPWLAEIYKYLRPPETANAGPSHFQATNKTIDLTSGTQILYEQPHLHFKDLCTGTMNSNASACKSPHRDNFIDSSKSLFWWCNTVNCISIISWILPDQFSRMPYTKRKDPPIQSSLVFMVVCMVRSTVKIIRTFESTSKRELL